MHTALDLASSSSKLTIAPASVTTTRAGIATVIGKPNAGKSTLLNRLVGQKLAITSPKPQTTRRRVVAIISDAESQIILHDTPGLLNPRYALHEAMLAEAVAALHDADVIVYLVDAAERAVPTIEAAARLSSPPRAPVITVLNKIDLVDDVPRREIAAAHPEALLLSAMTGEGVELLRQSLVRHLPESPFLYDAEDISTQNTRFFAAELVRETALELLDEEVPYSVACEIEEFREDRTPVYIRANVFVERESQKRILIGHDGARIREIGRESREKIESLIGTRVYLDLWVKVLANWRRDVRALRRFGFHLPEDRST